MRLIIIRIYSDERKEGGKGGNSEVKYVILSSSDR
jgi:hypothetical protein